MQPGGIKCKMSRFGPHPSAAEHFSKLTRGMSSMWVISSPVGAPMCRSPMPLPLWPDWHRPVHTPVCESHDCQTPPTVGSIDQGLEMFWLTHIGEDWHGNNVSLCGGVDHWCQNQCHNFGAGDTAIAQSYQTGCQLFLQR